MGARGEGAEGPFNIVAAESAHPAFDKAGVTMDIPVKRLPLRDDFRADPAAMAAAIDDDTMMMVSAPCFPHGVIEDISMLSPVAEETGVWLRLDACVGGYLTPFVKRLGRELAGFDFEILAFDPFRLIRTSSASRRNHR